VLTLSIHQFRNYPADKPPSTIDIHLADGAGDEEYLKKLRDGCEALIAGFQPQLVMYVAGADPYCEDRLGGLNLTIEGLRERDRMVMKMALEHRAAVAVTLAGGYAMNPADTVTIHANTARAVKEVLDEAGWRKTR
jgi:acetoin utilization deacetylase AcuC-like enzyme